MRHHEGHAEIRPDLIQGDGKFSGYANTVKGWAKELMDVHHATLEKLEAAAGTDCWGYGCTAAAPWHKSIPNKKNIQSDKKLKAAYHKHLDTLTGPDTDARADALHAVKASRV